MSGSKLGDINKFEDCPYNCTDGRVFNTDVKRWESCPYCADKRKQLAADGRIIEVQDEEGGMYYDSERLPELLGFNNKYVSERTTINALIPEKEQLFMSKESVSNVKEGIANVLREVDAGYIPSNSYCFGLGIKGNAERLAYVFLSRAYLHGMSVSRYVSASELGRLVRLGEDSDLQNIVRNNLIVILVNNGVTRSDIEIARGIMQQRAVKGNATIFITDWTIEACSGLLGYVNAGDTQALAKPYFVEYLSNKGKASKYINDLIGVESGREIGEGDIVNG